MLVPAVAFYQLVVAVHILAVVVAFGGTFAYPVFVITGARIGPAAMPWYYRMLVLVSRRVISPGLAVILVAGIYLAADLHQFSAFYVQWGIVAVIVLGALEGGVIAPRLRRLAEIAARDVAVVPAGGASGAAAGAAGSGFAWSGEYEGVLRQVALYGALADLIVVITVFLMATRAGA